MAGLLKRLLGWSCAGERLTQHAGVQGSCWLVDSARLVLLQHIHCPCGCEKWGFDKGCALWSGWGCPNGTCKGCWL